ERPPGLPGGRSPFSGGLRVGIPPLAGKLSCMRSAFRYSEDTTTVVEVRTVIVRSFDPFREFDRLAESFFGTRADAAPFDAVRRGDEVVVEIDLPGVDPASIDVTVERNQVSVRAERTRSARDGDVVLAAGRRHGRFR